MFPSLALKTHAGNYLSAPPPTREQLASKKAEVRADAESADGDEQRLRIKCQREFVLKARVAALEGKEGGSGKRRLLDRAGPSLGSVEDELHRK